MERILIEMIKEQSLNFSRLSSLVSNQLLQHQNPTADVELNSGATTTTMYQQAQCMVVPCGDVTPRLHQ
eukprot:3744038-Ditylum_brightwellii.AAC.1